MRPRMTILRWMMVVAIFATWLWLLISTERLRRLSREHMSLSAKARVITDPRTGTRLYRPTPTSAWHLAQAGKYHHQAELAESLIVATPLAGALFVGTAVYFAKRKQRPPVT